MKKYMITQFLIVMNFMTFGFVQYPQVFEEYDVPEGVKWPNIINRSNGDI